MSYNVSKLATKAECDQAIEIANERKADLVFEKTVSSKELTDQDKAILSTQVSLITVKAQITGTETAIASMPEGAQKWNKHQNFVN